MRQQLCTVETAEGATDEVGGFIVSDMVKSERGAGVDYQTLG